MHLKILLAFLVSFSSFALEIDEKLTTRFITVSKTKKTVLINRGIEDGLVMGDHARFFLTDGVVARGIVVKLSPVRSIWSLYRLIDPDNIAKNKVVTLKITDRVSLTGDRSKSLTTLEATSEIPSADFDTGLEVNENSELFEEGDIVGESKEMASLEDIPTEERVSPKKRKTKKGKFKGKRFEAYTFLMIHLLSTKACLLYTSPSPRDATLSRMPSSA